MQCPTCEAVVKTTDLDIKNVPTSLYVTGKIMMMASGKVGESLQNGVKDEVILPQKSTILLLRIQSPLETFILENFCITRLFNFRKITLVWKSFSNIPRQQFLKSLVVTRDIEHV